MYGAQKWNKMAQTPGARHRMVPKLQVFFILSDSGLRVTLRYNIWNWNLTISLAHISCHVWVSSVSTITLWFQMHLTSAKRKHFAYLKFNPHAHIMNQFGDVQPCKYRRAYANKQQWHHHWVEDCSQKVLIFGKQCRQNIAEVEASYNCC